MNFNYQRDSYQVMLEGLCIVRLNESFNLLRTTVKPNQYKAVWYAGQGTDDRSCLEALTNHPSVSRFLLSSNAPGALTHARSSPVIQPCPYCLAWDSLRAEHGGEDFSSDDSTHCPRPQFVRMGRQKKEEPHRWEKDGWYDSSDFGSHHVTPVIFSLHPSHRCVANVIRESAVCKRGKSEMLTDVNRVLREEVGSL